MDQINRQMLDALLEARDISTLNPDSLQQLFQDEMKLGHALPDRLCTTDPRNGDKILYASHRGSRPQDNLPAETVDPPLSGECPICQGQTTGVIDVVELSEGYTFINKNLYPIVYPFDKQSLQGNAVGETWGMHFLQWTSSFHDRDWHNMPLADLIIVMNRLVALEQKLLETGQQVLILKNYGRLVGGSLAHGHQQIILTALRPNRFRDNQRFLQEKGELFAAYLLRENPAELLIHDYGPAVLLVPYFMRRPLEMMLLLKDSRQYLHELLEAEIIAVAQGWQDGIRALRKAMPSMGRETAYNITCHNGAGAGLYFEFLPYTQESGGLEHLGIYACQETPRQSAGRIRRIIAGLK